MDDGGVGQRIARLRKMAGLQQHQLASRAFMSTSLVKKVEQGRTPPSAAFVAACARVLGVEPAEVYGLRPSEVNAQQRPDRAGIDELRTALHAYDDPELSDQPMSAGELRQRLDHAERLRRTLRFDELGHALPLLLHQLYALCQSTTPATHEGEQARAMLHDTYRFVATVGARFGQPDLAAMASERHVALAPSTGDPLRVAISAYHRSTHHLQHGHFGKGLRLLDRAQDSISPDESSNGAAVAAQLHLRSAVLAARAGDGASADEHITTARTLVSTHVAPDEPYYNVNASPLNIDIHWCAVPVEYDDGTAAVTRAAQTTIRDRCHPERVGHHHIDQARAWYLHGDRDRAISELNTARAISPQHTRRHPSVHETVRALAEADRRATDSLAGFARWAGIRM